MESNNILELLESFFALFKAHIRSFNLVDERVFGTVAWDDDAVDDDEQSFLWRVTAEDSSFAGIISLCNYLVENSLIEGDKIIISEIDLRVKLILIGWNKHSSERAIEQLCDIEVKKLDEGQETDSFFIHF